MIAVAELKMTDIEQLLERARTGPLSEQDCKLIRSMVETLFYLSELAEDKQTTIAELRRILQRSTSEKTRDVFGDTPTDTPAQDKAGSQNADKQPFENRAHQEKKSNGHGRNGASAYKGANKIRIAHESLTHGDRCPECSKGKLYGRHIEPAMLVRVVGGAPLQATVYELERLRCNLCRAVFTAQAPEGAGAEKI